MWVILRDRNSGCCKTHGHDGTEFIYTVCIHNQSLQHSTSPFQFIYKILDRVLYEFKSVYNRANIHHFDKSSGNFCSLLK